MCTDWGEPERAPHKREVHAACLSIFLSVCLSVCPYIHDTKIYKNSSNLRDTFLIAAFMVPLVNCFVCQRSTNM